MRNNVHYFNKTAYDNQHSPAYTYPNLNIDIYDNIHKDDKQQWTN